MDCCGTAILPLPLAAKEAWMSIYTLQRIAARWRFCLNWKAPCGPLALRASV